MTLERAWQEYRDHTEQMIADPRVLADGAWMKRRVVLDLRWRALFEESGEIELCN